MCVEEVIDGLVIGTIHLLCFSIVLFHNVLRGYCGLAVGFGILFICRLVEALLHGLHK